MAPAQFVGNCRMCCTLKTNHQQSSANRSPNRTYKMANKRQIFVLLFQLSSFFLLASIQCSNHSDEPFLTRDDENDDRPARKTVKKWFNSLLAKDSPGGNSNRSTTSSGQSKPYLVPVPVPMAAPVYPYHPAMPYMAYPYSYQSSRSPSVVPLPISPYSLMASTPMNSKMSQYSYNYPSFSNFYMASPNMSPYNYDSRGIAYAIPVPLMPYTKR